LGWLAFVMSGHAPPPRFGATILPHKRPLQRMQPLLLGMHGRGWRCLVSRIRQSQTQLRLRRCWQQRRRLLWPLCCDSILQFQNVRVDHAPALVSWWLGLVSHRAIAA